MNRTDIITVLVKAINNINSDNEQFRLVIECIDFSKSESNGPIESINENQHEVLRLSLGEDKDLKKLIEKKNDVRSLKQLPADRYDQVLEEINRIRDLKRNNG